jgi:hypothetical protein
LTRGYLCVIYLIWLLIINKKEVKKTEEKLSKNLKASESVVCNTAVVEERDGNG